MNGLPQHNADFSSHSLKNRIDLVCDAFEQAAASAPPRIERFLMGFEGDERAALFGELLSLELEMQPQRLLALDDYVARFPDHETLIRKRLSDIPDTVTADSFLAASPMFSATPLDLLEPAFEEQLFADGDLLMKQGELGESLMVVCDGNVEISTTDQSGKSHVIDHAKSGQVLGEIALLTSEARSANAKALGPVRAKVLAAETFHQLAHQNPEISVALTHLVAERLGRSGRDALTDKVLDGFRIQRRLGRGGMGIVYQAEALDNGDRVALKMMSHRLVYDKDALRRFQQEADIIESFQHTNIVRMLGRFAAFHTFFIVMEYCPGRSLAQLLESDGALDETNFRRITAQIASSLQYAHQASVVHRDIKPANVMLTSADAGPDSVKLMDFGLAEPTNAGGDSDRRIVGTPRYMAPEQRLGESSDEKADYFAFACLAYEMLTNRPVFEGDLRAELKRSFAEWKPPELSTLRSDLHSEIESMLQPALHVDPEQRSLDLSAIANWA